MTELRQDFLTGDWVAISASRAQRPFNFGGSETCPFCIENAHMTPDETYRSDHVRVFPNRYPALTPDSDNGYGIHEVLVDTDTHEGRIHELSVERIAEVFFALQSRMEALSQDDRIKYVQVFKNYGKQAGASIGHSHWQILAMSEIPGRQMRVYRNFERYFKDNGVCYLCEGRELETVYENFGAIAYVPDASLYSDSVCLMPRRHVSKLSHLGTEECVCLAEGFKRVLCAMLSIHPEASYNVFIQDGAGSASHVYLQLIPRLGSAAGLELATGCFINSISPSETAKRFRNAISII